MAVLGLTIHTFMNGVGLAGSVEADMGKVVGESERLTALTLPGLSMFLAIVLHKPADALAISMVLSRKRTPRQLLVLVQLGFALMVPIGAAVFCLTQGAISGEDLGNAQLTGAALSFSAGTFLFIALSDLLPEVQFHRHDRLPLFLTLALGVALMGGIALLEGHGHGEHAAHEHGKTHGTPHRDHHDDQDDDKDAGHDHGHEKGHDKDHHDHK
jgi:zinc and cadmium transporter